MMSSFLLLNIFNLLNNFKKRVIGFFFKRTILKIKVNNEELKYLINRKLKKNEISKIYLFGKHSYGLKNLKVLSWGEGAHIFVGSFCSIANNQKVFLGGNHRTDWVTTFPFGHILKRDFPQGLINGKGHPATKGHVIIENDVWIGEGCTIMSGIRIGSGSVIAANSVVVKDVQPYSVVGGNPAKLIKNRFNKDIVEKLLILKWWDMDDTDINKIIPILQSQINENTFKNINNKLSIND